MSYRRFLIFDSLGSLLWAVTFAALSWIFSDRIEQVIEYATGFGWWFGAGLIAVLVLYVGWKIFDRQRLIRSLRVARIAPEELKRMLDSGEEVLIVDLRDALDFAENPNLIPTARRLPPDELEARHEELPRDRDLVLYCTCPNEVKSARRSATATARANARPTA